MMVFVISEKIIDIVVIASYNFNSLNWEHLVEQNQMKLWGVFLYSNENVVFF
jgi:hypothetical protein